MPAVEEESFPRGGSVGVGKKRKHQNKPERELFQSNNEDESKPKKKKKDRHNTLHKRVAVKKRKDKVVDTQIRKNLALIQHLTPSTCPVNMLVLGCVKEVRNYFLDVSLPNGLVGKVPITAISSTYTNLLQQLASGDYDSAKDLASLNTLFRPGMVVRCKITEISKLESKRPKISLTIDPKDINSCLEGKKLKNGMVLCGCIKSVEDHGYVVDLGVPGILTFLKKKEAEEYIQDYNDGNPLYIGSYLHFMINSDDTMDVMTGESRTLQVTINPRQVFRAQVKKEMGVKLTTLLPGMRVSGKVQKVSPMGVKLQFLNYTGTVHRTHLPKDAGNPDTDKEVTACVLYVHPVTKVVSLTCLPHLVTPDLAPRKLFGDFHFGQVIEDVKVVKVDAKMGVFLKLDDRITAYAHLGNISDSVVKDVCQEFPKGSSHRCRILNFDYSDNLILVTLKESVLAKQYLRYEDLKVAEDLEAVVKSVTKGGVLVTISNHMKGFIPNSHLANVPLKHPEKRFTPGLKITARVLALDPDEKKTILTTKKSILNSKYPKITEYSEARPRMVLEGVVVKVMDKGLRVLFYNGVKGFVPKDFLSTEFIEDPSKVFYVGQVVKTQVVKCVPNEERLLLSLQIREKQDRRIREGQEKQDNGMKEAQTIPEDLKVGQVLDGVVSGKVEKGLFIKSLDSQINAFLPKQHLSDHMINCALFYEMYKKGDTIDNCVVLSIGARVIVTRKQCFVSVAKEGTLVTNFEDAKLGVEVPGVIRNHMDYGVFVDLAANLIGLTPKKFAMDGWTPDSAGLCQVGQSVVAKVAEVDAEKKRLLLSLRLKDCYHGDIMEGVDLLERYLKEMEAILQYHRQGGEKKTLASHFIGETVKATITKVTSEGVLCTLPDGVKGVATDDHTREVKCVIGKTFDAMVLYVDLQTDCLELSLNTTLVKNIQHYSESKYTKARKGQVIKSEVLLIKDDFVLISLKGHTLGKLAFLPAKRHLNDFMEKRQFQITQQNAIVVKRVSSDVVMAILQIHDTAEKDKMKAKGPGHNLVPGVIVKATVKTVLDFQLNINIGEVNGRIHISEVADKVKEGTNPIKKFKKGQQIEAKVIGYKELKTNKYLPVTHSKIWSSLPECTLRRSKIKSKGLLQSEDVHLSSFEPGDQVTVYVQNFNKNLLWVHVSPKFRGKISSHNISQNEGVQADPLSHFKVGHAYKATVIGIGKANVLELSFLDKSAAKASEVSEGDIVEGRIKKVGESGLLVELNPRYKGRVGLTDICDKYEDRPWQKYSAGQSIKVCVLKCDKPQQCVLSLRPSRLYPDKELKVEDPELSIDDIEKGKMVRGYVTNNDNRKKVFLTLSNQVGAHIPAANLAEAPLKSPKDIFFIGKVVCGKITKAIKGEKGVVKLSLLEADTGLPNPASGAVSVQVADSVAKKRKASESKEDSSPAPKKTPKTMKVEARVKDVTEEADSDSGVEEDIKLLSPKAKPKATGRLTISAGFSWDNDVTLPPPSGAGEKDDPDSESEEEEAATEKKKTRRTRQERLAAQREEERRLVEKERHLLSADGAPQGAEDFDRLVLQSPDSSLVWLAYMAHHLETTEIEKARAVAERALKTISFREEQEKLNVWVAYLNLENMYGTPELLKMVFERAVQHNDSLKVHNQLAAIYEKCNNEEAADQLYTSMIRRFGSNKDVWINYGLSYFKHNKADSARKLMQRSLKSLDQKYHLEVLSKFAQMEYKHGEPERGRTMFENVLSTYPRRTDLWSVYIDMVVKQGLHQQIRNIFERVIALNLSAKKMKFFFKKQLDFEEKYGNEETVAAVKQKALDYVEARASLT